MPPRLRKNNWEETETSLLIDLYRENAFHLHLASNGRHRLVYHEISEALQRSGFTRSIEEVKKKIQNLNRRYREEKSKIETTGATTWKYFPYVQEIIELLPHQDYSAEPVAVDKLDAKLIYDTQQKMDIVIKNENPTDDAIKVPLVHKIIPKKPISQPKAESSVTKDDSQVSKETKANIKTANVPKKRFGFVSDMLEECWKTQEQNRRNSREMVRLLKESLETDKQLISLMQQQNNILKSLK